VDFDLETILVNHMGIASPRNRDRVLGWVRFDPEAVPVSRIVEIMGERLDARLVQPVIEISRLRESPEIRIYRDPHVEARVTLVGGAAPEKQVRIEVSPAPGVILVGLTVRPWGLQGRNPSEEAPQLARRAKVTRQEALIVPVVLPGPGDGHRGVWLDVSYRAVPDPYRPTPDQKVTHHLRVEVPVP
jgi:hypothetical protein